MTFDFLDYLHLIMCVNVWMSEVGILLFNLSLTTQISLNNKDDL